MTKLREHTFTFMGFVGIVAMIALGSTLIFVALNYDHEIKNYCQPGTQTRIFEDGKSFQVMHDENC